MNCEQIEQGAYTRRFLDGGLSTDLRSEFKVHVADCDACQGDLQLAASLMLQEPIPASRVLETAVEPEPSMWVRLREWLFPSGVGMWQPALAFAAVLVVSIPMLKMAWMPADLDVSNQTDTTWRAGDPDAGPRPLEPSLKDAIGALQQGEVEQVIDMLDTGRVNWDRGRMENVFTAYRVRARAAAELGWNDAAMQDLNRAMSFAELDPQRVSCVEQDIKAVKGEGTYCALPAASEIR